MLENAFNVSVRSLLGLPYNTHRYLIQPLANDIHLRQVLVKRFLQFCENLKACRKIVIKDTFNKIQYDARTTTGKNLAEISHLVMVPILKLTCCDAKNIRYDEISNVDEFRVGCIKELIDIKHGNL